MIDTVKLFTIVNRNIYDIMSAKMILKQAIDKSKDNTIIYEFSSGQVPSYNTSIVVSFADPGKYFLPPSYDDKMVLSLECSLHKVLKMQNAYAGFYDFEYVAKKIISMTSEFFRVDLPEFEKWFVSKVDIAVCKDLGSNENVIKYINSLSRLSYPRRKLRFFADECLYVSGTTTTLKIYNKLLEFMKHDMKKAYNAGLDVFKHKEVIKGFIRFECSIKKKKLDSVYGKNLFSSDLPYVSCSSVKYEDLYKVWSDEFMRLLKIVDSSFTKVWKKEEVKERLFETYGSKKGMMLYTFYTALLIDGYDSVKKATSSSRFYAKISDLKKAGIDFSRGIANTELVLEVQDKVDEFSLEKDYCFNFFGLAEVI